MESPEPKSTEQPADKPWLRHYPSSVPHTLDYPDIPLYQLLADTASSHPERTALLFFGRQTSYEALFDEVKQVASGLLHLGLKKGDRVAIMLPNCPQLVAAYYGVLWAGGVVVMVNPLYTARELRVQFEDSEARFLIALDQVYQRAVEASSDTHLEKIIVTGIQERLPFPLNLLYRLKLRLKGQAVRVRKDDRTLRYSELLTHGSKSEATLSQPKEDLALLQYTGGTTGIPKGAMLTHFNLVANCTQIRAWLPAPVIEQATIMGALPFFHTYGMTIVMNYGIMIGARLILLPRFDLKAVLKAIQKYKPQLFPGVPTMYIAINNHPSVEKYDLKSVDLCISGAAPLPQEVKERFEALTGGHLVEGYGLTEASPVTHCNLLQGTQKPGSIGLPWVDTECRVVDPESGEALSPGEVGELAVRGPQVMRGYWQQPEETAAVLKNGWLHTGDLARMDEEGFFYIVDRKKEMIVSSGFNVYPREVEEVLYQHPAVKEAAVIGVHHPYRGESVKAYVVLKNGATSSVEDLIEYCREHLAAYKVPREVEFASELPKSLIGKVLHRVLVEREETRQKASAPEPEADTSAAGKGE